MRKHLIILAITALAYGCSTAPIGIEYDRVITSKKVGQIKVGVTTRDELNQMFGIPEMKFDSKDGFIYYYKDLNLNSLQVYFNSDLIVSEFKWSD